MMLRKLSISASALALAACASGPNYVPKPVSASAAAPFVMAQGSTTVSAAQPSGNWWRLYDDPVLDGLVKDALASNTDIRVAVARLAKARASLREERGAREPQVGISSSTQYGRLAGPAVAGEKRTDVQIDARLGIAYEVDLFGRISRRIEAAKGDVGAADADADAVRVAVVADTVRAYADAVSSGERIAVAQTIVTLLDRSLELTEKRHQIGLANGLDTARIATLRDQRTDSPTFRRLADELVTLLAYEATRDVRTEQVDITTPVCPTTGIRLARPRGMVPAKRASRGCRRRHAKR